MILSQQLGAVPQTPTPITLPNLETIWPGYAPGLWHSQNIYSYIVAIQCFSKHAIVVLLVLMVIISQPSSLITDPNYLVST